MNTFFNCLAIFAAVMSFVAWSMCRAAKRGDAPFEAERERMEYEEFKQEGERVA